MSGDLDSVARRLDGLEKRGLSQTRILVHLLARDMSVGDLVAAIYDKGPEDVDYRRLYMRVSRRLESLRERGLVTRALFGRERPYRITRLGRGALTLTIARRTDGREGAGAVWGIYQTVVVVCTGLLLVTALLCRPGFLRLLLSYGFCLLLGLSIACAAYTLRELV